MSFINFDKIASISVEAFAGMEAPEQSRAVLNQPSNVDLLKQYYPVARDYFIRALIVNFTKDPEHAADIIKNAPDMYAAAKLQALPFVTDQEVIRQFVQTYPMNSDIAQHALAKLDSDSQAAAVAVMNKFKGAPEEARSIINKKREISPLTDVD